MFKFQLLGKTRIPHRKNTANMPPVRMTPPAEVCIPMDQHIGAPATPIVKVGDTVKIGQPIAEASGYVSAAIFSPVSGKVTKIEPMLRLSGQSVPAIRIANDGEMTVFEGVTPPAITDVESLVNAIRACGLVGLGGAGFPTAVKLDAVKKGQIHTVVINAAECEPYITSDARTMIDDADAVCKGIELLQRIIPEIKRYIIGIENNKPACIQKMKEIFAQNKAVSVHSLPTLYPQGAEKVLIRNTTGLTVPEGKLPADVGVIVMNVTTLATLAKFAKTGMPLIEKCVTVDGSAIQNPQNVIVPIGTPIRDLIEFTGGFAGEVGKIILGGPMTGRAISSLDEPIAKTTNAIVALSVKDSREARATACIYCGRCVDACPHGLNSTAFSKALEIENKDERMARLEEYSINLCMECGCCAYVCPAKRPLIENIRVGKAALKEYKAHKASLK